MKKFLILVLIFLGCLFAVSVSARHSVTTVNNETIWIHADIPDTEKYALDEEANKDKIYCKTKTDSTGKVVQTDWYNHCTGEFVKSENADTCTKELRYPEFECEFAKGSNADKLYCRTIKDAEGNVVETRWFNFCNNELVKTEEKDACTAEFKNPAYKCYKNEIETEETPVEEEEVVKEEVPAEEPTEVIPEETPSEPEVTPVKASWFSSVKSFFRNLFK